MLKQLFALSLITISAKAACGDPVPSYESNKVLYDYRVNGADWGTIHNVKFPVCASGLEQSPIDLKTNAPNDDEIVLISSGYFDINLDQQFLHSDTGKKVSFDSASRSKAAMYLAFPNSQYDDRPLTSTIHFSSTFTPLLNTPSMAISWTLRSTLSMHCQATQINMRLLDSFSTSKKAAIKKILLSPLSLML